MKHMGDNHGIETIINTKNVIFSMFWHSEHKSPSFQSLVQIIVSFLMLVLLNVINMIISRTLKFTMRNFILI
jgi:hypothetical protein